MDFMLVMLFVVTCSLVIGCIAFVGLVALFRNLYATNAALLVLMVFVPIFLLMLVGALLFTPPLVVTFLPTSVAVAATLGVIPVVTPSAA